MGGFYIGKFELPGLSREEIHAPENLTGTEIRKEKTIKIILKLEQCSRE